MSEPKKFKKGWFKDELTVKGRTWFDYFAEDTYDPNDLIFSVCPELKRFINSTVRDVNNRRIYLKNHFEDFPNVTEDELTLFELETGCDLTELIEIIKDKTNE